MSMFIIGSIILMLLFWMETMFWLVAFTKNFFVVFMLLSCCWLIIICMISWQIYFSIFLDVNGLYINQSKIILFNEETGKSYECDVHTASRTMYQKYIWRGWYDFILEKGLKVGDVILFTVNNTPNRMYATVVNWDWFYDRMSWLKVVCMMIVYNI